ncbi:hypothetical protein Taro_028184 [Colocasia esculenta]|uniref:Bulb-type lectin domain-containing protein n=1 Tax=Colocasia esculenta TaxID=4460 RepID=A0A843VWH5_COLES|nr:hypothetical protein [Colocasia esculenta]
MAAKICSLILLALVLGSLSPPSAADNVLYTGGSLLDGQSLTQVFYTLIMQSDCNLVLYYGSRPVWASQTYGWGRGCRATMQGDGNFVVYTAFGRPVWASHTQATVGNYVLVLLPYGDVVIYGGSVWATGTHGGGGAAPPPVEAQPPSNATASAPAPTPHC